MTDAPTLNFMSPEHVDLMNSRLAEDAASKAACAKLEKPYVVGHRLNDGPEGTTVFWSMIFDPAQGVRFSLEPHDADNPPDSVTVTSYNNMIRMTLDQANMAKYAADMVMEGDADPMAVIGEAFQAGHAAAAVKTIMPEVAEA